MTTSRFFRVLSLVGFIVFTAASQATPVLGCDAASRTNVDCAEITGATPTEHGVNFFTDNEFHVGYRLGILASPDFMDTSMSVSRHSVFANSVNDIDTATRGSGNTMLIKFDAEAALTGMVLSGLGWSGYDQPLHANGVGPEFVAATAQITAYNDKGEKAFERAIEGNGKYVYVNFGYIVPQISTILISSGAGIPGLTSTNTNVAYFITALPEPGSLILIITGLGALAMRRRLAR